MQLWNTVAVLCHSASQGIWIKRRNIHFLSYSNNNDDANLCYNENFIQELAYLVNTFEKLSNYMNAGFSD
jgi:hypothetical protein